MNWKFCHPTCIARLVTAISCFCWLSSARCVAADASPRKETREFGLRVWRVEDGLPHNSVRAITQTSDGYLWVGTFQGLASFDGTHFRPVPELLNVSITSLCEDQDGTLWAGTEKAGIWYRRNGRTFSRLAGKDGSPITINTLLAGKDRLLWAGSTTGLACFQNGKLKELFDCGQVRSLAADQRGELWITTDEGLKRLKGNRIEYVARSRTPAAWCLYSTQAGGIWTGGVFGAVLFWRGQFVHFGREQGLTADMVNTIYEDRNENVWFGTSGGLDCLGRDGLIREVSHEGEIPDAVYSIFEDGEGDVWVGARDGLYRLNPKLFTTYTRQQGLLNNNVSSVLEDKTGRIWIGTYGGGLHYIEDGAIKHLTPTNRWFNNFILGLWEDSKQSLWIGTDFEGGLFRCDGSNYIRYWKNNGFSSLADPSIRTIFEDEKSRRIWVGTPDALNVAVRGHSFRRYTAKNGLAGNTIKAMTEDDAGNVWIGTDGGLSQFNGSKIKNFTEKDGLPDRHVTALFVDDAHELWIGTANHGLVRFRDGKFTCYNSRRGLFSDEVLEILQDDYDRLWMTSRSGIFWVTRSDLDDLDAGRSSVMRCVSYGQDDGLGSVMCNDIAKPAAWKSRDGRLWFATVKGLSVINPASIVATGAKPPPVVIEEILSDHEVFQPEENLVLPPGKGELEFHFAAMSFHAPERTRFRYKLDGVDADWLDAGGRRSAHYNRIAHGNYRFRVTVCGSDGVWSKAGDSVSFTVSPHFWQNSRFEFDLLLAAGLIGGIVYRVRAVRLRDMERLRARIAADLHDEIGSSISSISLLARKIQKSGALAEAQKLDLTAISRIANSAANSIRDIVWFITPEYDTLQDLLVRMKEDAGALLGGISHEFTARDQDLAQKLSLDFRRNVLLMFKEILGNVTRHSKARHVVITVCNSEDSWQFEVHDDGVGFDAQAVRQGNGLKNLRNRAAKLRGQLAIKSQPGEGTTVTFFTSNI